MENAGVNLLISQLVYYAAPLLVFAVGVVLGLALIRKYPAPASLVLLACGMELVATPTIAGLQAYLVQMQASDTWSTAQTARAMDSWALPQVSCERWLSRCSWPRRLSVAGRLATTSRSRSRFDLLLRAIPDEGRERAFDFGFSRDAGQKNEPL